MTVFIPHTDHTVSDKRELFSLTRPFFYENKWNGHAVFDGVPDVNWIRVCDISQADIVLFPFPMNYYVKRKMIKELSIINAHCQQFDKKAYGYISGDFGIAYPEFSNITYFRMSGFKSQLSQNNKGFPVGLSDHFQNIFQQETIVAVAKRNLAVVGFCGHATVSMLKKFKELVKCLKENIRRFIQNPIRKDWEPLFASAYERAKLLKVFEKSALIRTNFIYRNHYRAGAQTDLERKQTTLDYYNNIASSDYVICVRGAGNFSVRFYETLMMGKIPVFVDTDCLLPFEDEINWKQHVVWIAWKDRKNIAQIVSDFHQQLSNDAFIALQLNNRKLWKETLSVKGMLEMLKVKRKNI